MNSQLLYAATVAISILGSLATPGANATEGAPTRAQVKAAVGQAAANGSLVHNDYDTFAPDASAQSTKTRAQVQAERADAATARTALVGPETSRLYNPFGTDMHRPSVVTRAEVKADVRQAATDGTLQRTDFDYDAKVVARRVDAKAAASTRIAKRAKHALRASEG